MICPCNAMSHAQIMLNLPQQRRSHFSISHGPVGTACFGQLMVVNQHFKLVAGRLRVKPSGNQHGASKGLHCCFACANQFSLPEPTVERGVVRDHGGALPTKRLALRMT